MTPSRATASGICPLTVRFVGFFDHDLKGDKAPARLTEGVPYLMSDERKAPAGAKGQRTVRHLHGQAQFPGRLSL